MNEQTGEISPRPVTDLIRPEPKPLYAVRATDASGETETFHATDDHPWRVHGRGWVNTVDLRPGDRIDTASDDDLVVGSVELTARIEQTYNLTVNGWHTFLVGEDQAVVHNIDCRRRARQEFRRNQNFRNYAHRQKQQSGLGGDSAGTRNRNMTDDEITEFYEDWIADGRPPR